jgi:ComF family protein
MPVLDGALCAKCGDPVDGVPGCVYRCTWCQREDPAFDLARSALRYRGPVKQAIHVMKYEGGLHLAAEWLPWLLACLRVHCPGVNYDVTVPVPMNVRRERERSYNQARLLAAGVAEALSLPLDAGALARLRETGTQTRLTIAERRVNVFGAFGVPCRDRVRGRRVLLVDDVMTTGATVNECSKALRDAGAASVHVLTVARG